MKIEIKKIGNSDGLILPRELLQRLDLKQGEQVHIRSSSRMAACGSRRSIPSFARTMEIARRGHGRVPRYVCRACKMTRADHGVERAALDHLRAGHRIHAATAPISADAPGLRDRGMLRSALVRPVNKWQYEQTDLAALAAAYAFGLARNHAFVDGNKRIAFLAMMVFLRKQRHPLRARSGARHGHHPLPRRRRGQRGKPDPLDPG